MDIKEKLYNVIQGVYVSLAIIACVVYAVLYGLVGFGISVLAAILGFTMILLVGIVLDIRNSLMRIDKHEEKKDNVKQPTLGCEERYCSNCGFPLFSNDDVCSNCKYENKRD